MTGEETLIRYRIKGRVKWFDPAKGFGFLFDMEGGTDVLLHSNLLRSFGQSSIIEGALVEVMAVQTARGRQADLILSITPPSSDAVPPIAELADFSDADIQSLPLQPARVKWFDRNKGFGFANVFGRKGDVFLHIEVLRRFGFTDLVAGEGVGLRVFMAERSMVAAEVVPWEKVASDTETSLEYQADIEMLAEMAATSSSSRMSVNPLTTRRRPS